MLLLRGGLKHFGMRTTFNFIKAPLCFRVFASFLPQYLAPFVTAEARLRPFLGHDRVPFLGHDRVPRVRPFLGHHRVPRIGPFLGHERVPRQTNALSYDPLS